MNKSHVAPLLILLTALFAGCSSTPDAAVPVSTPAAPPPVAAPAPPPPAPQQPAAPVEMTKPVAAPAVVTNDLPPHLDPKHAISSQRSVFFDFDDDTLKNQYAGLIEMHGKYLASKPALSIKVEGNADERGSKEYNLSLGQKRAETVLRALRIYGVRDSQMEPVSWGEERPIASGHDESAWARNRRADLIYPR